MATKARMHEITMQDGNGTWTEIVPGPSRTQVLNNLNISPHVKVVGVKSLPWQAFEARPNDHNTAVEFVSADSTLTVSSNNWGYAYLIDQFPHQVAEVQEYLNDINNC
jgi:hypothetical protein